MKIKMLNRNQAECTRERAGDLQRVFRNPDPALHPFERAREYTRALNAVKLDRVFAKPFVSAMDGHSDGVFCMAKNPKRLNVLASGACDGELRVWNLSGNSCSFNADGAHKGFVRGLSWSADGSRLLSCGDDKTVKLWSVRAASDGADGAAESALQSTFLGARAFTSIDHTWDRSGLFATGGAALDIWHTQRSKPVHSFSWGVDMIHAVRYNPAQANVVGSTASDRSIALYDTRLQSPVKKLVLQMVSNTLAWNPMEPFNFTVANEDHNLYSFDMRKLDQATCVHMDHTGAVLDIDFSPTGQEFVSGSYDRTLRIFKRPGKSGSGHSREVYHTRRMQRIFCVKYSMDSKYVLSGSDDTNIRLWKADASKQAGVLLPREKQAQQYQDTLKRRYGHLSEIRRIEQHRHVPKVIMKTKNKKREMRNSALRKEGNRRKHSAPGVVPFKAARKKKIVTVVE